jgi:hypothetical protein
VASRIPRDVAIAKLTCAHAGCFFFLSSRNIGRRNAKGGPGGSGKAARASQAGSGRGRSLATLCWDKSDISVLRQAVRRLSAIVRDGLFGCDEDFIDLSAMVQQEMRRVDLPVVVWTAPSAAF